MKLTELSMAQFMSVGAAQIPLADQGLVLIEGENKDDPTAASNGSGKSTIFEALLWGLYGTTARGLSNDEIVKKGEKQAVVTVCFEDDAGVEWTVIRKSPPHKLFLDKAGVAMTLGKIVDTQGLLDGIIGMDAETFMATVMFSQGQVTPFSTMTDAEQKDVLQRLIGLEDIDTAHEKARMRERTLTLDVDAIDHDVGSLSNSLDETLDSLKEAEENSKKWAAARKMLLDEYDTDIAEWEKESVVKGTSKLEAAVTLAKAASDKASALEVLRREEAVHLLTVEAGCKADWTSAVQRLGQAESLPDECPTCKQFISVKRKADFLTVAEQEVNAALGAHNEARDDRLYAEQEHEKAGVALDKAREVLKQATKALEAAEARNLLCVKAAQRVRALKMQRDGAAKEENTWGEVAKKHRAKAALKEKELATLKSKFLAAQEDLAHVSFLVEAFGNKGLKSYVMDTVTPLLNDRANHYAQVLSRGSLRVEFQTQSKLKSGEVREKFAVNVTNEHGSDVYKGNSGGERRKVDVAIALALQSLAASRAKSQINVAFYDEPFDALDSTAGEYAMELLQEEAQKKDSVFVITHREELKANFPHVWRAVKSNNTTEVETHD